MHSWRVLLLPYLDQLELYNAYRFDEPWDGPNNRLLADRMPRHYCFSGDDTPGAVVTNYLAVVGPETMWPREGSITYPAIKDRAHRTILIVENQGAGVHWMEPRDLLLSELDLRINSPLGISSKYEDPGVALVDGTLYRLTSKVTPDTLRAMLRIDTEEVAQWDEEQGWQLLPDGRRRPLAKPELRK